MNRKALDKRMRELSIYSDFYYRKELGALAQVIQDGEQLNCILTGVHEGNRKMLAITDQRVIILFAGALAAKNVTVMRRSVISEYRFEKKLPFSNVSLRTDSGTEFVFTNTQRSLKELFEWAMQRPLPDAG